MNAKEIFGQRITALCKKQNKSQIAAANELHISQPTFSRMARGKYEPSLELLGSLCEVFHTTADYLLGRVDDDNPVFLTGNQNLRELSQSPTAYFYYRLSKEQRDTVDYIIAALATRNDA